MAQRLTSALVLMNADAQHGAADAQSIAALRDQLEQVGIAADIHLITDTHPVHELADCAIVARYDLVIAAGGDGTVQQVAACLLDAAVPLGILPLGTMNTIAFNLGIPSDLAGACQVLTAGTPRRIDMGLVNGKPFLEVVTIGTATEIAGIGEDSRHHGVRGVWQGVVRGIHQLYRLRRHAVTLTYAGHRTHKQVWEVTIANMPIYGLRFAPSTSAQLDDGLLDVILTRQRAFWRYAWYYLELLRGREPVHPQTQILHVRTLRITSREPLPIAISGYPIGTTPAKITVIPHALTVMTPPPGSLPLPRGTALSFLLRSLVTAPVAHQSPS